MTPSPSDIQHWFRSDGSFNLLYPRSIRALAGQHWTPLLIAQMAADFLVPYPGVNILDIGSGAGKFCLAAAHYKPEAYFYGIEQRKHLVVHAETARKILSLRNALFLHGNLTQLNFGRFDHFYFYNSFYENLPGTKKIDDTVRCSQELYNHYTRTLYDKLAAKPEGTRLATFHNIDDTIPGYRLVEEHAGSLLKFWMKR